MSVTAAVQLNKGIRIFFSEFVRVSLTRPRLAGFFLKVLGWQRRASRLREAWGAEGVRVPPIMIFSITNRCNLSCKGCYHQAIRREKEPELSGAELRDVVAQADDLGISFFVVAGGEPMMRPEFLDIAHDFPQIVFLIFTNGMLLDAALISRLAGLRNVVPVLSLEGEEGDTDGRRGEGVYRRLKEKMEKLREAGIFFAISVTVTRFNFDTVTDRAFVQAAVKAGCRLFFLAEYTPIREGTEEWMITDGQRESMKGLVAGLRKSTPAVFIAVPWDEEEQGGCLAAGRGFVHVSAQGDLEPCPFAPYSDASLRKIPLKDALKSRFLQALRENHDSLAETGGGCALWQNRQMVRELLSAEPASARGKDA